MVSSCSALGCKERAVKGSGLTFHRFPKNTDLRDKWVKALRRKNFEPSANSRVCEKHFTREAYNNLASRKTLKESAVPEIFDFSGFVKDGQPKIQKLADPERINCIQFVDVDSVKNENLLPGHSSNRTVIVIDNVIKARRVEEPVSCGAIDGSICQVGGTTSVPVITSSFSLNPVAAKISKPPKFVASVSSPNVLLRPPFSLSNLSPEVTETLKSEVAHTPDMLTSDCTQKRLIRKTQQMKQKYQERLKVMNHVFKHLKKRKAFLENLLIRIKEKQLTSDEDVTDLMDCFVEEEEEEETMSSDEDSSTDAKEYEKTIAFIDGKISKFEKSIKNRSDLSNTSECEAFGLHLESVLKTVSTENATHIKSQISELLKRYQGKRLLKMYQDFNNTFRGLENIEVNEIE